MIALGVLLLLLGLFFSWVLFWLGVTLIVIGLFLNFGMPVGPTGTRRRYY